MKPLEYLKETKKELKKLDNNEFKSNNIYLTKLYKESISKALEDVINNKEVKDEELDRIIGIKK